MGRIIDDMDVLFYYFIHIFVNASVSIFSICYDIIELRWKKGMLRINVTVLIFLILLLKFVLIS